MAPAEPAAAVSICVALSFNGRTDDSDSSNRGSNPWGATKQFEVAYDPQDSLIGVAAQSPQPLNLAFSFRM